MSRRADCFDRTRTNQTSINLRDLTDAIARAVAAQRGTVSANPTDSNGGHTGPTSPVERALFGADCPHPEGECECVPIRPDTAARDLTELDKRLRRLEVDTEWVAQFVRGYGGRAPTAKDLREVAAANHAEPECELCRDLCARHEPVHRLGRCRWCYEFQRRNGRDASAAELDRHHAGLQVRVKA